MIKFKIVEMQEKFYIEIIEKTNSECERYMAIIDYEYVVNGAAEIAEVFIKDYRGHFEIDGCECYIYFNKRSEARKAKKYMESVYVIEKIVGG